MFDFQFKTGNHFGAYCPP